jgi:hypothetical protein
MTKIIGRSISETSFLYRGIIMKKMSIFSIIFALVATGASAYAWIDHKSDGTFVGNCNGNSNAFAGQGPDSIGYFTVVGPYGAHFSKSMIEAINKACGD